MKHFNRFLGFILAGALCMAALTGCGSSDEIDFSKGLTETGYVKGVSALDSVTLPAGYDSLSLPEEILSVSDEEVQNSLEQIKAGFSTPTQVTDRAIEADDWVNIDYSGSIDGVKFEGGTAAGQRVLAGSNQFIDDFLTQIIGHKPGESFDVNVTFPDPYGNNPEMSGKDAVFAVTINYIEGEMIVPELTDAFVKENFSAAPGVETLDELKAALRDEILRGRATQYVQNYLMEKSACPKVPGKAVKVQENVLICNYKQTAQQYQMEFADFLAQNGIRNEHFLVEQTKEQTKLAAKNMLIIQAIAEDAGIVADEAAIQKYFSEKLHLDSFADYETLFGRPYLANAVLSDLVIEHVVSNALDK